MNSVPLTDVLPWGDSIPGGGRTILICDSASVGGRFLLHTMAAQCLSSSSSSSGAVNTVGGANSAAGFPSSASSSFRRKNDKQQLTKSNRNGRVLWIHCGCSTDDQIRLALKKAGCDSASIASSSSSALHSQFEIINIMHDLSQQYYTSSSTNTSEDHDGSQGKGDGDNLDDARYHEKCAKNIYLKVKQWLKDSVLLQQKTPPSSSSPDGDESSCSTIEICNNPLIILDNVSLLSNQIGYQVTHALIQKIQNLILHFAVHAQPSLSTATTTTATATVTIGKHRNRGIGCLALLCSNDFDQEYYLNSTQQSQRNTNVTGGKIMQYIGGGGRGILCNSEEMAVLNQQVNYEFRHVWERSLVEIADGIIDVVPLASGFARDVHGRLIFTERSGSLGWKGGRGNDRKVPARNKKIVGGVVSAENSNATARSTGATNSFSTSTVNFCCHDNGVRAIRLRI